MLDTFMRTPKSSFARRMVSAFGGLLDFGFHLKPFPRPMSEADAMRADWERVGLDLRKAMHAYGDVIRRRRVD